MDKPRICAVITDSNLNMIRKAERFADVLEVRIDLIGDDWEDITGQLSKPWIACNRASAEGGHWEKGEARRIDELLKAIELGVDIIDIELGTSGLAEIVPRVKKKARCLLSTHYLNGTPSFYHLKELVRKQLEAGADICKVVTTAQRFEDNATVLRLISEFPRARVVSFAMGALGLVSRILCPLAGGYFTYASIEAGKESAPWQLTLSNLNEIYGAVTERKRRA
jgi:3-dehydroquinate dehydratase-1